MPRKIYRFQITSPELWEKVNNKNIQLVQRFLKDKNNRCSDLTINGYDSEHLLFLSFKNLCTS